MTTNQIKAKYPKLYDAMLQLEQFVGCKCDYVRELPKTATNAEIADAIRRDVEFQYRRMDDITSGLNALSRVKSEFEE